MYEHEPAALRESYEERKARQDKEQRVGFIILTLVTALAVIGLITVCALITLGALKLAGQL